MEVTLFLKIDPANPDPINVQIAIWIRQNIQTGKWENNRKLPSESDLAKKLKVSRGTIRKAIETLIGEKLIVQIHGKGTFVTNKLILEQQPAGRIAGFTRDLISRGIPHSTDVLLSEVVSPYPDVANLLGIKKNKKIFHMKRLRKVKESPVIIIENHINYKFCEGIEKLDFSKEQHYVTLENKYNLDFDWARRTYISKIADDKISKLLQIKLGAPIMYLEEIYHLNGDTPIELTRAWIDAKVFHITTLIKREDEKQESSGIYR